jgi:hypothetical protein
VDHSCGSRQVRKSRRALTSARAAAFAIGVLATCGCVLFAAGCGREPSPTAPRGPSPAQPAEQTHIRGVVTDKVWRPIAGALVSVLDGPLAGATQLTDDAGRFELSGRTTGTVTLRASRDGFQTSTQVVSWQPSTSIRAVEVQLSLDTLEPPIGLEPGDYMLTVAIDLATASGHKGIPQAPCVGFPVELASRSYRVTIVEGLYGRYVRADDRPLHFETLFGFSVAGRFVGFEMDYGIPEDFSGFRFLNILGLAPTTKPAIATGSSVSIPFYGEFRYCELKSARGIYNDCSQIPAEQIVDYHSCTSDHATMVFTKR